MTLTPGSAARWTGLVAGLALAAAIILMGRVPGGHGVAGAALGLSASPATELGVSPAGREFMTARGLKAGASPAEGSLVIANYTGRRLTAGVRLSGDDRDLDRVLQVAVSAAGRTLYVGPLGGLRKSGRLGLRLAARRSGRLVFRAWVPRGLPTREFQGRFARLNVELQPQRRVRR